jgi:hypothetical protein
MLSHWSTFVLGVYPQTHTAVCSVLKAPVQYLRNLYMGAIHTIYTTISVVLLYRTRMPMSRGSHSSSNMCTIVFICVCCVTCDLKLCMNYVEPEIGAAGARLFVRGK